MMLKLDPNALYSSARTHGIHNHNGPDCHEYVVGQCILAAVPAPEPREALERLAEAIMRPLEKDDRDPGPYGPTS